MLQEFEYHQRKETNQKVHLDTFFSAHEHRPYRKVGFHDAEIRFDLLLAFTDLQNIAHKVVQQIGANRVKSVVFRFFYFCRVKVSWLLFGELAVFCYSDFLNEPRRFVWVFALSFSKAWANHALCSLNFFANLFLVCRVFGRTGDNQPLLGEVWSDFCGVGVVMRI